MKVLNLLLCFLLAMTAVMSACTHADAPAGSASEASSGELPSTGAPDTPSSGGPEPSPTTSSTGDGVTTTTATSASTGPGPYCGDDEVNPGEECDLGRDNSQNGVCTSFCKNAACGDGFLFTGYEQCDLGQLNLGTYGGCRADCTLAPRCGDATLDENFEQCDMGPLNGSGQSRGDEPPCDANCNFQARLVFITSETYTGELGGLAGADDRCQSLAEAAGLENPQNFRAWLSDGIASPHTRFQGIDITDEPYILLSGRVVADNFADLTQNGPRTGISITETGEAVFEQLVRTNTSAFGDLYSFNDHCAGWTSASAMHKARVGYNALAVEFGPAFQQWKQQRLWTSFTDASCSYSDYRLYCFEDPTGDD